MSRPVFNHRSAFTAAGQIAKPPSTRAKAPEPISAEWVEHVFKPAYRKFWISRDMEVPDGFQHRENQINAAMIQKQRAARQSVLQTERRWKESAGITPTRQQNGWTTELIEKLAILRRIEMPYKEIAKLLERTPQACMTAWSMFCDHAPEQKVAA